MNFNNFKTVGNQFATNRKADANKEIKGSRSRNKDIFTYQKGHPLVAAPSLFASSPALGWTSLDGSNAPCQQSLEMRILRLLPFNGESFCNPNQPPHAHTHTRQNMKQNMAEECRSSLSCPCMLGVGVLGMFLIEDNGKQCGDIYFLS